VLFKKDAGTWGAGTGGGLRGAKMIRLGGGGLATAIGCATIGICPHSRVLTIPSCPSERDAESGVFSGVAVLASFCCKGIFTIVQMESNRVL